MENINEYTLSFRGKCSVSGQLNRGVDYVFKITATIPKAEIEDNEDGSINVNYKARLISCETESEGKKVKTVARQKWSQSQKIRFGINDLREERGLEIDEDKYYEIYTNSILHNLDKIADLFVKIN
jgi:predicted DsbA family dithiol-disulfide isomerase